MHQSFQTKRRIHRQLNTPGTLERERRQAVREGRPDPREMEAEITAVCRRVRELEKENELFG